MFKIGAIFEFWIRITLAIFDLQVTSILPTKFGVNWIFGSGEEIQNTFSTWRPPLISDQNNFIRAIFYLQVAPILPAIWPFASGNEVQSRFSRIRPCWTSDWKDFSYF